jgi:hypothetical protein
MALPTLIGNDGRRAVIAFTGTESLRRWKEDARPVPAPASRVWAAAVGEADAVVIDVAGPVPLVVEGARLRALASGEPPPLPYEDPDIRAEVAAVTPEFTLAPGSDTDLAITLPAADAGEARRAAGELATRLGGRLRRGIEIRLLLSRTHAPDSPPHRQAPSARPPAQGVLAVVYPAGTGNGRRRGPRRGLHRRRGGAAAPSAAFATSFLG